MDALHVKDHLKTTSLYPAQFALHIVAGLEYVLVSLVLHCFLRLGHALYCRSGRCLAGFVLAVMAMP